MDLIPVLLIPDVHRPFHSQRAYNIMLEVASYVGVKRIYIKGDFADFYNLHQHGAKDPRIFKSLEDEVADTRFALNELDHLFPDARKYYVEGNHEYRLARYIQNKAADLFGFITAQQLLEIEGRPNWSWHRYWPDQKLQVMDTDLYLRHEPLASTALATLKKGMCSLSWGHTHRIEEARVKGLINELRCWSDGWLGDKRKDEVFGYVKGHFSWQMGFTIVLIDPHTNQWEYDICEISEDFTTVFQGKMFKG